MKQGVGRCTRFGYCKNADNQKKISLTETMGICPLCGGELYEISPSSSFSIKWILSFFMLVCLIGILIWQPWVGPSYPPLSEITHDEIRVVIPKVIHNGDIQTSVDIALTQQINKLADNRYVKQIIDLYYGEWLDRLTINDANARKFKITKVNYVWLHEMVSQAAFALDVKVPDIYLVANDTPNAYVTGVTEPILVIHSKLIELMKPEELLFVIGHELGHIKLRHLLVSDIVATSYYALDQLIPTETLRGIVTKIVLLTFLKWSRESEISADRMGMILVGSEEIASRALIKFMTGLDDKFNHNNLIDIEDFKKQQNQIENNAFDLRQIPILLKEVKSTHPFIGSRIEALSQYKKSPEYAKLFLSGDNNHIKFKLSKFD